MDISRPELGRRRRRRRALYSAAALVLLAGTTLGLSRLKPAAPRVDRHAIYTDTVKRGEMLRQVRGNGTLVPEEVNWVPAITAGRVERIRVLPGAAVKTDTILVELSNPEVEHAAFEAAWQLKAAEAQFNKLKVQLETERLGQEAQAAQLRAECSVAKLDAQADAELAAGKLVDRLTALRSQTKAEQLDIRCELEEKRLRILQDSHDAQLAAQQAEIERLRAFLELRRNQEARLQVRSGLDGVLQRLGDRETLQVGQQLPAGALVARVANPARLKAEIKIVETQAKDVAPGQKAVIDTRNGKIAGHVVRVDPAVQNGTVTVDVTLDEALPRGARPDLSVEGVIELERLADVLHVGRPVQGQADSLVGLFKVSAGGREAERVPVRLGRSSVNTIEVLSGLELGDTILLNDMSQYDAHDRVRLN
ncbi:MAG: HlyD family efflux transporter periplasmic adaptor subunit [Verrucomicrobiales bacterium]|nr:HlyD family efflux transporter periplasmic adaptor subunit [Verrucomicrobiales bacterium]